MHQLIYKSTLQPEIGWQEIVGIAEHARKKNNDLQMTGMLVMHRGEVLQVLEGECKPLSALFLKIANDPRHKDVQLLHFNTITERHFGNWKMKEIEIERLPDSLQDMLKTLMPYANNHRRLPKDPGQAEGLLMLIAAATSER
jgi:hypothetical protein